MWIVPKKPDSKGNKRWRTVIDYRALNEKTIGNAHPLPNITEIFDQLGSAKYFSIFSIAYTSRLLNSAEQNCSTIEKELLAIVHCVNYFHPYLYGHRFLLVTDHKPLVWLHSVKDLTSRLVRWRLKLAEYDYEVIYKAGKINANADALSRNPPSYKIIKKYILLLLKNQVC